MARPDGFEEKVVEVVRRIPAGEVLTYGDVAEEAGFPGAARAVGNLLRTTAVELPWWRVVGAGGRITSPAAARQSALLESEGWVVTAARLRSKT